MTKTVCILFGGRSSEHEISLISASYVIKNCRKLREFELRLIAIDKSGRFYEFSGADEDIADGSCFSRPEHLTPVAFEPGVTPGYLRVPENSPRTFQPVDCFFPVLHGRNGEDGRLQGLFEMMNARYTGCGTLSSALMMDKEAARRIFKASGIEQTPAVDIRLSEYRQDPQLARSRAEGAGLRYPLFVKPANAGSSVGISKINTPDELPAALDKAFAEDVKVLIEQGVEGREIECAVLQLNSDGSRLLASYPGEIIPGREFYDYEDKYDASSKSRLVMPAELSEEVTAELRDTAIRAFRAGECRGLARVDFFVCEDGRIILNEINTLPGFTAISMYPKLIKLSGIEGEELVRTIIMTACQDDL